MFCSGLHSPDTKYMEACLRALRALCTVGINVDVIYKDPTVLPLLMSLLSKSNFTKQCVTTILVNICQVGTATSGGLTVCIICILPVCSL